MNTLLDATNGAGYCYSTPTAWSLAAPLAGDATKVFCADSAGVSMTLSTAPKGPLCK